MAEAQPVGAGFWGGGRGGPGAMWLLLVFSGCLVCGSGTARAAAVRGARRGLRGVVWKLLGFVLEMRGRYLAVGPQAWSE